MDTINLTASSQGSVRLVYSPDDGGYYLEHYDSKRSATRVSRKVWRTEAGAVKAWRSDTVKWESWN